MLGTYFYHEIIRKTIVSFGTLFNNIHIRHKDENSNEVSDIKVPISYGPIQKFLARIEQKPDLRKRVALTLPRMSFEITSLQYDSSRKISTMQTFKGTTNTSPPRPVNMFMPTPYNIGIQLNIITKFNDDMLQIIEQILPYFQPHFNLTIDLVSQIGEKRDVPITLENIQMNDNYEGDFQTRRNLIYTLNFVAKTYLYGPVSDGSNSLIRKVQVDYYTNTDRSNATRQLRYVATPRAIKDYDNDQSAFLAENIDETVTSFDVSDSSLLSEDTYIQINQEEMFIKSITGNTLTVIRAQDSSSPSPHLSGDPVNEITVEDNELIPFDDDFGFDEERFSFGDGLTYSTTQGVDVDL